MTASLIVLAVVSRLVAALLLRDQFHSSTRPSRRRPRGVSAGRGRIALCDIPAQPHVARTCSRRRGRRTSCSSLRACDPDRRPGAPVVRGPAAHRAAAPDRARAPGHLDPGRRRGGLLYPTRSPGVCWRVARRRARCGRRRSFRVDGDRRCAARRDGSLPARGGAVGARPRALDRLRRPGTARAAV